MYSLHCHNGVMTASFVKYPVAHLTDQVLELVCNLAHLIIINIMSHFIIQKEVHFLFMSSCHDNLS